MKKLRVTVQGKSYDVVVELLGETSVQSDATSDSLPITSTQVPTGAGGDAVPSPLAGKVVSIRVNVGQKVNEGEELMVLEAMKMNTHVFAPGGGTVAGIMVQPGENVEEGQSLVTLKS